MARTFSTSTASMSRVSVSAPIRPSRCAVTYQGLNSSIKQSLLPYVLPRYEYRLPVSEPDLLGRPAGVSTRRTSTCSAKAGHERSASAAGQRLELGSSVCRVSRRSQWMLSLQGTGAAFYNANVLNGQPNYAQTTTRRHGVHGQVQVGGETELAVRAGRCRHARATKVIEPIAQLIAAPNDRQQRARQHSERRQPRTTNSPTRTLFQTESFRWLRPLRRRRRAPNYAPACLSLEHVPGGQKIDGLVGAIMAGTHRSQSLSRSSSHGTASSLGSHLSRMSCARASASCRTNWIDFTARGRFDHSNGDVRFADASRRVSASRSCMHRWRIFVYGSTNPYALYLVQLQHTGKLSNIRPTNIVQSVLTVVLHAATGSGRSRTFVAFPQPLHDQCSTPRRDVQTAAG